MVEAGPEDDLVFNTPQARVFPEPRCLLLTEATPTVTALLAYPGVDVHAADGAGRTARALAMAACHYDIARACATHVHVQLVQRAVIRRTAAAAEPRRNSNSFLHELFKCLICGGVLTGGVLILLVLAVLLLGDGGRSGDGWNPDPCTVYCTDRWGRL